ncbi:hypothetical protein MXB_5677 [Myxobolus squamalis]|nr:hypothetical protein MXB_5677 [Myxobolus squamalis]
MISTSKETRILLFQPITNNMISELLYGLLILLITLLLIYLFYQLSSTLGKLERPWWIESDSPLLPFSRVQQSSFTESPFPFTRALTNTISNLGGYSAEVENNDVDSEESLVQENNMGEPNNAFEEDYPAFFQLIRSLVHHGYLENVFYIFSATVIIILTTTIVVLGFSGMPIIALNKYAKCVSSGSVGIMFTNMFFYYSFMCPFFYLVHAILKKRGIFYFAKIFLFAKFVLTLLIEYLLTPFLYGYILYSSLKKLRKGFLFPLNDNADELKRFISETFYESFPSILCKIAKSYFKYLFFFLFLETFIPYWISFKFFNYINLQYSNLGYRKYMFEIYIMVHLSPYMSNRVEFKNIIDNFISLLLAKFAKILSLESFLFGKVWDRLGKHVYSPIHSSERSNLISSDPFIKPNHFKRNVLPDSHRSSVVILQFLFLECVLHRFIFLFSTGFTSFGLSIYQAIVLILIFFVILPLINGTVIDLITNVYKCLNGQTSLVFPIHNWFIGFMFVKFQLFTVNILPSNFINSYPILVSLRHGFQTQNYSILVYEFAIPYITKLTVLILAPYVLTFGLGHFFSSFIFVTLDFSIEMQYRLFYQIYFVIFAVGLTILSISQFKNLYTRIIRYTKDTKLTL